MKKIIYNCNINNNSNFDDNKILFKLNKLTQTN